MKILNNTEFYQTNSFSNPRISQIQSRDGETQSLNHTSLSTNKKSNKPREEDNIGVLTVPQDLCKETRKVEQKNWLKNQDYLFILGIVKSKIPVKLQIIRLWKN